MADDRWTTWQAEQAGTSSGPSAGAALALFAVVALVLLALVWSPAFATNSGRAGQSVTKVTTPPPCAQHFPPTCKEGSRGR
jgi:hypothetical protein